jgi:hypothetical protein
MEFLAKLLNPLAIILLALAVLVLARRLNRRRPYQLTDLQRLGISPDDVRLSTGDDRGPLGAYEEDRRGLRLVSKNGLRAEDRVMVLALDFYDRAVRCPRAAEGLAALRIAENLMTARSAEALAA